MNAAIIAIGSEMLGIGRVETNSFAITRLLERYGVSLRRKAIIGDDRDDLAEEFRLVIERYDAIFVCGGLGPTEDDLTKEVVAEVFRLQLVPDDEVLQKIRDRFAERGIPMPEANRKQALVFNGQTTLPNSRGTAPGFHIELTQGSGPRHLWLFPGVPYELEGMLEAEVEPWLREQGGLGTQRRILKIVGLAESQMEELIAPYYARHAAVPTILAGGGELQIHLFAPATDDGTAELNAQEEQLRALLGENLYGRDDDTMESVVGALLKKRSESLAAAESCTGGLFSSRITDISGSSSYFLGGVVSYTGDAKMAFVDVGRTLIEANGEVSEGVARAMATGVRKRFASNWGVGITGIAGPTGGTPTKPVGTVHVAVASEDRVEHRKLQLSGARTHIKRQSTQYALDLLRRMLLSGS
jgi:nicotinamide-nucleotide amidase